MCKYNVDYLREHLMELKKRPLKSEVESDPAVILEFVIRKYGYKIDHADEILPSGFCLFHDPDAWRDQPERVRTEFFKWLKEKEEDPNADEIVAVGFKLPDIDLNGHRFEKKAIFSLTRFNKVNFKGARFKGASFWGTQFDKWASFDMAKFVEADFWGARFKGASFWGTQFDKWASFRGAQFEGWAVFMQARFGLTDSGGADFWGTNFKGWAVFRGADFERADFGGAYFRGADFGEARFKRADFRGARFEEAYFERTRFDGGADFRGAVIKRRLVFSGLRMHLMFNRLRGNSYISLRDISFDGMEEELRSTRIDGHIIIDDCFVDRFSFINTDISPERLVIRNPKYSLGGSEILLIDKLLFLAKTEYLRRRNILKGYLEPMMASGQESGTIQIDKGRLSSWIRKACLRVLVALTRANRLLLNELTYINNLTSECRRLREKIEKIDRTDIPPEFDAKLIKEAVEDLEAISKDEELTLDNVLSVYRGLREHYDYALRYEDSGRLFVGEMRLREKMSSWRGDKLFFKLYDLLAVYGESIWRPIIASALIILLFSFLLNWDRGDILSSFSDFLGDLLSREWNLTLESISGALSYWLSHLKLRESLLTFFQLRKIEDCGWFSLLERLIAIPVFGSFIVSLRRKLERRIRH